MTSETPPPTVLIVEDEAPLADLYAQFLADDYTVQTASDGEEALRMMDDDVAVVLLDRKMPGLSGRDVLESIREQAFDCRVAMVTAINPDFDIIEMGFDDYLVKPVSKTDLHETIHRLLELSAYDQLLQRYYRRISKQAVLTVEKSPAELSTDEGYAELEAEIADLELELEAKRDLVAESDIRSLLRRADPRVDT